MKRSLLLLSLLLLCMRPSFAEEEGDNHMPPVGSLTGTTARLPIGTYVLLRSGKEVVALKLTETIKKGDGGVAYLWYAQSDGTGIFTHALTRTGRGEVFEKYIRPPGGDGGFLINDGGILHITCGRFKLEWSLDTWLYLKEGMEIAFTDVKDIAEVNALDPELTWQKALSEE